MCHVNIVINNDELFDCHVVIQPRLNLHTPVVKAMSWRLAHDMRGELKAPAGQHHPQRPKGQEDAPA